MEELILKDFFYAKDQKQVLEFKALGDDRFSMVFSVFIDKKSLLRKLLFQKSKVKHNGLQYRLIDFKYVEKSKHKVIFECKEI